MKTRRLPPLLIVLGLVTSIAWGERALNDAELQALLIELTARPVKAWISSGTVSGTILEESWPVYDYSDREVGARIRAEMENFNAAPPKSVRDTDLQHDNQGAIAYNIRYAYRSGEQKELQLRLRIHQEQYYFETQVLKFLDLMDLKENSSLPYRLTPEDEHFFATAQPAAHSSTRFNAYWNHRRIVAWDGYEQVEYNTSPDHRINHAWREATPPAPDNLPTPLTAGLVSWGHGLFSAESLANQHIEGKTSATQTTLTITTDSDSPAMCLTIGLVAKQAPTGEMAWAQVSYQIEQGSLTTLTAQHSHHQWIAGRWVPTCMVIESPTTLLGADRRTRKTYLLEFDSLDHTAMRPSLANHAKVQYRAPGLSRPLRYQVNDRIDVESLLAERLALANTIPPRNIRTLALTAPTATPRSNCATLALTQACRTLGKPVEDHTLAPLVNASGVTSLLAMAQWARAQGLHCQVGTADIDSLATLDNCQAILHLPGKNHFVLLAKVDTYDVWCIDLTQERFLYHTEKQAFVTADWQDNVALVLSSQPIDALLPLDTSAQDYIGGGGYTCTYLIQEEEDIPCDPSCWSSYTELYEVYGCEPADSGSCSDGFVVSGKDYDCMIDPYYPAWCSTSNDPSYIYYDFACN
ncbi:cysteine peptidase family C39 domain-containing protein [Planctomycetota bacterium]